MEFDYFIGIDISKNTLDFFVSKKGELLFQNKVTNSPEAILAILKELKSIGVVLERSLFCMEHTGIYQEHLINILHKKKAYIWLESAVRIKRSGGLQRGKNDKVDAQRIASYAYRNREEVKLWQPRREVVERLKRLTCYRARLISAKKQLSTPLTEEGPFVGRGGQLYFKDVLKGIEQSLFKVETSIGDLIRSDDELRRLFNIITSVNGIGTVTACHIIAATNEFKEIDDPRKFACYAGVAPFEHSSGTSVRGRTRVSHLANKTVKANLHMAALSARKSNVEIRNYYERKIAEGKHVMTVMNAVRNKLIHRIFACVKQNRKYENSYCSPLLNP